MATFQTPPDHRYIETDYVVDATHDEMHHLWWRYHEHYGVPWTEVSRGETLIIGEVDKRPIAVSVFWGIIVTKHIAFVDVTSQLADYKMSEEWQKAVFPCLKHHGRHSDVANFGNIVSDIERNTKLTLIRRDYRAVEDAIRAVPLRPM